MENNNQTENKENIYSSLLKKRNGNLSDYEGHESEINRLCKLGILKKGRTSDGTDRFGVTDLGVGQLRYLSARSDLKKATKSIIQFVSGK